MATGDTNSSGFTYDGFEGIDNSFTNISVVSRSSHNLLLKALRYGQWWMLKCLLPEERGQSVFQEMLRKEFEILIQMQHPHIVRAFNIEEVGDYGPCIVMEWLEGESLHDFLARHPDEQTILRLVGDLADAVEYVHRKGFVHRDLKPENVIVSHNGENVKLIDFGLADSDIYAVLKQSGGTDSYMSPEQEEGGAPDIRNDIYSFGVMLKQMNLGKRFEPIVNRCLEPIDRRYSTIKEVKDAIRAKSRRGVKMVSSKWLWLMASIIVLFVGLLGYGLYKYKMLDDNRPLEFDANGPDYEEYVPEDLTLGEKPTLKIVNPDFHGVKGYGWNFAPNCHPIFYNQGNISLAQFYIQTFDFWQNIGGLEPGDYELSVHAFHRPDSGQWSKYYYEHAEDKENGTVYSTAELYADSVSVRLLNWATECNSEPLPEDPIFFEEQVKDIIPNTLPAAGYYFNHGHYLNKLRFSVESDADSVRIGLRLHVMRPNSLSWVAFDTFRLRLIK